MCGNFSKIIPIKRKAVVFSFSACSESKAEERKIADRIPAESISQSETEETAALQPEEKQNESSEETVSGGEHIGVRNLIVYFSRVGNTEYPEGIDASTSASIVIDQDTFGTTEYVARMIQESIGGDIHFIRTREPYTADFDELKDVNHEEMDTGFLPPLMESNLDMGQYDTVFIGYPVWWGEAPRIIDTFMESYDFSGKTIVPFCTSGSSGVGSSATNLEALTDGATWLSGTRLNGGSSRETIVDWVNGLGLDIKAE